MSYPMAKKAQEIGGKSFTPWKAPGDLEGSTAFNAACKAAEIPATRRQWKKWLRRTGKAYAAKS